MRILFINFDIIAQDRDHPRHLFPPLDMGYAMSLLEKEGHLTFFLDFEAQRLSSEGLLSQARETHPDIVVIKPSMHGSQETIDLAQALKQKTPARLIFLMGPFVTYNTTRFLFQESPIDVCILSEPEYPLLELCQRVQGGIPFDDVRNLAFFQKGVVTTPLRPLLNDLDEMPFPKQNSFVGKGYTFHYPLQTGKKVVMGYMLTSRGCPYSCSFCSPIDRASFGQAYHGRSPESVVEEMAFLVHLGVNTIYFLDDLFTVDKARVIGICQEILRRGVSVSWVAQSRVDRLDEELLGWMKKAGCSTLCLGMESGTDRILKTIDKGITREKTEKAVRLIHQAGLLVVGYFIIGSPTETRGEVLETIRFAKGLRCDLVQVHFFSPYPGSPSADQFVLQDAHYSKFNAKNNYSQLSQAELVQLQKQFYRACLLSPRHLVRQAVRQGPTILRNFREKTALVRDALHLF